MDSNELAPIANYLEYWYCQFDPFMLSPIAQKASGAWLTHPYHLSSILQNWASDAINWQGLAMRRLMGSTEPDIFPSRTGDERFAAEIWAQSPLWNTIKQWYLFNTRWLQDSLYTTPTLSNKEHNLSAFWLRQWLNAICPTNFFLLNPVAQRKALESRGESLLKGLSNLLRDMNEGDIAMADREAFKVGKNLATTPGAVVYRGKLLEVIHYNATTSSVHAVPMVLIAPWINKYYVLDLGEKKSLVQYLVKQGFSVFVTSWKNPGPNESELSFDDYITDGIDQIVKVALNISQNERVHLAGYCIGGTLTTTYLAWLARRGDANKIATATLLATLTDFERPGDIEVYLGTAGLKFVEQKMQQHGYLDGKEMAASFRLLRSNSLIWNYWVGNYLMGETPRAFDILSWNMDTTRMARKMHSFYLWEFYYHNRLIQPDALTIAGETIDIKRITTPLFMVATEEDHIAPWQQIWKLVHYINAPITFTLSSSGHILGIINPPTIPARRQFWQGTPQKNETAEQWRARVNAEVDSWWPSWLAWLTPQSGKQVAFKLLNRRYPRIADAPGSYVLG